MKIVSENRLFRTLAEQVTEAIVLTDPKGRIVWTNQAFSELCGYEREEVSGQKPGSFLQGPDTDYKVVGKIREAYSSGETHSDRTAQLQEGGRSLLGRPFDFPLPR